MDDENGVSRTEVIALIVALAVVVIASIVTVAAGIPFPFNIPVSFVLGVVAGLGTLKIVDPRTEHEVLSDENRAKYNAILSDLRVAAREIEAVSQQFPAGNGGSNERLGHISQMVRMLVERCEQGVDHISAARIREFLKRISRILTGYAGVKTGQQFMAAGKRQTDIFETEMQIIPLIQQAITSLGMELDAGKAADKKIAQDTFRSLLQSLNLLQSMSYEMDTLPGSNALPDGSVTPDPLAQTLTTPQQTASQKGVPNDQYTKS